MFKLRSIHPSILAFVILGILFAVSFLLQGCTPRAQLLGDQEYKNFNYARAIEHYETSLAKKNDHEVRLRLANCYVQTNQARKAEEHYRKLVSMSREDRLKFTRVLMINGKYAQARKVIRTNLRANPSDQDFQLLLAACDSLPVFLDKNPAFEVQFLQGAEGLGPARCEPPSAVPR